MLLVATCHVMLYLQLISYDLLFLANKLSEHVSFLLTNEITESLDTCFVACHYVSDG